MKPEISAIVGGCFPPRGKRHLAAAEKENGHKRTQADRVDEKASQAGGSAGREEEDLQGAAEVQPLRRDVVGHLHVKRVVHHLFAEELGYERGVTARKTHRALQPAPKIVHLHYRRLRVHNTCKTAHSLCATAFLSPALRQARITTKKCLTLLSNTRRLTGVSSQRTDLREETFLAKRLKKKKIRIITN